METNLFNFTLLFTSQIAHLFIFIVHFRLSFVCSVDFKIPRFELELPNIRYVGDTLVSDGEVRLTDPAAAARIAYVTYAEKVPLWNSKSGMVTDFTTHYSFTIDHLNQTRYGHGIAFFLSSVGFQTPLNSAGGFFGLFNTTTMRSPESPILTIEFDTYLNTWDPGYQHVGINNNSIASSVVAPWNASQHNGKPTQVWITYNASIQNLSVFWSNGASPNSSLSYHINLKEVLPEWVTIGFSAATGDIKEQNMLSSWEFVSSLTIDETSESSSSKIGLILGLVGGCVLLVAAGIIAFLIILRWRKPVKKTPGTERITSSDDDLERGAGPRRFSYKELSLATDNFSIDRKLGQGGFGGVYKGYLFDLDIPIAVKKISRGSKQGKKEYVTEIKIISRLRHRNLVQLIGWCHDQGEFLLVYEFMPNGSLDTHLFGQKNPLSWALRHKITLGLASALLYLHEEWEQCVIHRDIKAGNIMLDSNFNVKLGDFGLARLMDHELDLQTTDLAGTLGYLAPECLSTGKASKESDLYSFGVVLLEIATGRKPRIVKNGNSQIGLLEWVWDLYGSGELLSAVDERLNMEFDPNEVECVMIVGLWCAHPDRILRPSIRQAIQVLQFEVALPNLPRKMPVAVYYAPNSPSVSSVEPLITHTINEVGR